LGWSKASETIGGKSLIQWVVERLATLSTELIIVTAQRSGGLKTPAFPTLYLDEGQLWRRPTPPHPLSGEGQLWRRPTPPHPLSGEGREVYPRQFGRARDKPPRYDASLAMTHPPSPRIKLVSDIYPGKGPLGGIYTGLATSSCLGAIVVGCDMPFLSVALLDYMAQFSPAFDVVVPRIREMVEPLCAVYSKDCLAPIQRLLKRNELRISELFNAAKVKYIEEDEINSFDPEHLSFFNINTRTDLDKARRLAFQKGLASGKY